MAAKRRRDNETEGNMKNNKTSRKESTNTTTADMLTNLPESLQLLILSSLDFKQVVQTSVLSKSWISTWTHIPILNFSSYPFTKLRVFDKFVVKSLSVRQYVRLDKLIFKRHGICSARILKKVFDYAFSHHVKELEAMIDYVRGGKGWPILLNTSSESLRSLKLESCSDMSCSLLGPRSGSFMNLTNLHLMRVDISDLDPFSGFPSLQRLKIISCHLSTTGNTLKIHSLQLSELTIFCCSQYVNCIQLMTPKLTYFNYQGINFPGTKTHKSSLPVLDTVIIGYNGICYQEQEKVMFDDLLKFFDSFCNAKSLTVFSSIVHLLSLFPDDLANRCSPFQNLMYLNLDFSLFHFEDRFEGKPRLLDEALGAVQGVKDYMLHKTHDANCRVIYPNYLDVVLSSKCNITDL